MLRPVTIALDAMGGDVGPAVCVPAGLRMLKQYDELRLVLVGQEDVVGPLLGKLGATASRVRILHAEQVVTMDEPAADALRKKKKSSMRLAINLVKEGEADACVSSGNSGALMATARFVLKTLPGINRPAMMTALPTKQGRCHMLDLGANTNCTPEQLFQFALMGSVVAADIDGIDKPRIGLLNIGVEDIKGNNTVREAAALLSQSRLNYVGFIEGDAIARHMADVVVCDGFSGNVALKSMEGTAALLHHFLKQEFKANLYGRMAGLIAWPVLRSLAKRLDPRRYNGASLVGLNGIVIKSHGGADQIAFQQAIHTAMIESHKQVPIQIRTLLSQQDHSN